MGAFAQMGIGKKKASLFAAATLVVCLCGLLACSGTNAKTTDSGTKAANETTSVSSSEAVLDPYAWKDQYPNQFNSYIDAGYVKYSDKQPNAHGKVNTFFSGTHFSSMTPEVGCFRCHTSQFGPMVEIYGEDLISMDFETFRREVKVGVTCYSCHGNTPGEMVVANSWISEAASKGGIETSTENLVCAQCHSLPDWGAITTNGDPSTWSMLQYGLDPDTYWEHFQSKGVNDPVVPPEESEFNSYTGSIMDKAGATCADCHMSKHKDASGAEYSGHTFQGVTENEALYENCLSCHKNSTVNERKTAVATVKEEYAQRRAPAQAAIDELSAAIETAIASNSISDSTLKQAQQILSKATFYLNYGSDWGDGIHIMGNKPIEECFDKAIATANEGLGLLS